MSAYYNEFDPKAAAWLRELIAADLIAPGDVDERSIADVQPADLVGYTQCHFFAGIGGWSYALRLTGWPDDRPVWTGSCPCQPFSAAGKRLGTDDPRHLWPEFFRLIRECRPQPVFGEQVSGALGWLDLVSADLEGEGYACRAVVLGAHSVGAPHIRQRLYWVADHSGDRHAQFPIARRGVAGNGAYRQGQLRFGDSGPACGLALPDGGHPGAEGVQRGGEHGREPQDGGATERLADAMPAGRAEGRPESGTGSVTSGGEPGGVAHPQRERGRGRPAGFQDAGDAGESSEAGGPRRPGFWADLACLPCRDGIARPTQPGLFPLAHGVPGRVGLLRGYGNAIVPEAAAEFIKASQGVPSPAGG